jgi:hypothetical protein
MLSTDVLISTKGTIALPSLGKRPCSQGAASLSYAGPLDPANPETENGQAANRIPFQEAA